MSLYIKFGGVEVIIKPELKLSLSLKTNLIKSILIFMYYLFINETKMNKS